MAANLQMDMGELIAFLKTGKTPDGETSFFPYIWIRNIGVATAAIGAAAAWHQFHYVPQQEKLAQLREEYAAYDDKAAAMPQMEANIARMESFIKNERAQHLAALDKFYGNESIDSAYKTVSDLARHTDMTVVSIKSGDIKKDERALLAPPEAAKKIAATPIPVQVRLKGSYQNYLRFIAEMRDAGQIYAVGHENIGLTDDERFFGHIEAELTLIGYALDKSEMLGYLEKAAPKNTEAK